MMTSSTTIPLSQGFDLSAYFHQEFQEHQDVVKATLDKLQNPFLKAVSLCRNSLQNGGKILFFGNGGSAADAQHLATELTVRFIKNRAAISALSLTTDTSALTAIGNDLGFNYLFSRQIEALGKKGDVAIGITTSGKSPNVMEGFKAARAQGLHTIAFTGGTAGDLLGAADLLLVVPSATTRRIQEMHITIGQMLCGALEIELGLV
jgi:D-sedoheptulose 7-phosphate isomerase